MMTEPLPWDYDSLVAERARSSPDLLDLGTGGGEWLASFAFRPARTVATEAWEPNVPVAADRLRPLGVDIVAVEPARDNADQAPDEASGRLPFPPASFHLVTCRHEAFVAAEVARVLAPGGSFITQQVASGNDDDFYRLLAVEPPRPPARPWSLALATEQLEDAGVEVVSSGEAAQISSFADVGALAWYLKAIPWTVPGFSIAAHRDRLADLQQQIEAEGPVCVTQRRFWLEARKRPAAATTLAP